MERHTEQMQRERNLKKRVEQRMRRKRSEKAIKLRIYGNLRMLNDKHRIEEKFE